MLHLPSSSKEYLHVPVTGTFTTSMTVEIAVVLADDEPASGDWKAATWDGSDGDANAKILIGPGTTLALSEGLYGVWVRITATPELPVLDCGALRIT